MVATVIVSGEGVYLSEADYVVRELSLYFCDSGTVKHYTFDPPQRELTGMEKRTNNYVKKVLGGVGVYDVIPGALEYDISKSIITALGDCQILCVGNVLTICTLYMDFCLSNFLVHTWFNILSILQYFIWLRNFMKP